MSESAQANLDAQRAAYGEPLRDIFDRLKQSFGINQSALAKVLGISAPMLSQLNSAQRVKIGNPAVLHRVQRLNDLAAALHTGTVTPEQVSAQLEEIRTATGTLTQRAAAQTAGQAAAQPSERLAGAYSAPAESEAAAAAQDAVVVQGVRNLLRAVASGSELREAAEGLQGQYPRLAELLRLYGTGPLPQAHEHYAKHKDLF
ncbi:helix-turn-helix domain-containing protein [Nesterenkonia massiliensis]|uniref:helix-turn-helix domain-containing protein n=1 Tax=Nesterenkonia massiliensis TaxID=1232429 RepID=UPI0003F7ECD9|nr:hypothetical protein [Nesterenkonia massiliensis]